MPKKMSRDFDLKGLAAFLESGKGVLLDTLPGGHFGRRHIQGAINACVYEVAFLETVRNIIPDTDTPVVCYGAGQGSLDCFQAKEKLVRAGYADVSVFPGGIQAWREAGFELQGQAPESDDPPYPVFQPEKRLYSVDPEQSLVLWTGRNARGQHNGVLALSGGEIDFSDCCSGYFHADMRSIRDLDIHDPEQRAVLEAHLASDDFFFVDRFPSATYHIERIMSVARLPAGVANHTLTGLLELRGVSRNVVMAAHFRNLDNGAISLQANFNLDRTMWGVLYGSARFFKFLGKHLVYDHVSLDIRIILT